MFRFLINVFLVLWLGLLTAATIESHRSADWSQVKGTAAPTGKESPQDLLVRMEKCTWRRNATMELGEAEVNRYLSRVISGHQNGPTGSAVRFERVALDFEPGICRVIFAWNVKGRGSTSATLDFTLQRKGENFVAIRSCSKSTAMWTPQPPGTKFDGANMHYFMRFTGGIGMHAGYLPGYPASHGCVRMPQEMAQNFFRNVSVGTPVEVRY